jgi:1-acyl-sn-glycerol-3-phosphate acyltransferase
MTLTRIVGKMWGRGLIWGCAFFCDITFEVRGRQYLEGGAKIVACKHQSAWETMFLFVLLDCPTFVLKQELSWIPFYGFFLYRMGMIVINRRSGARAIRKIMVKTEEAIRSGRDVVIFPEGTRTHPKHKKGEYQIGVAAVRHVAPVIPAALNSGYYWSSTEFLRPSGKIILEFFPPVVPDDDFFANITSIIEDNSLRLFAEAEASNAVR